MRFGAVRSLVVRYIAAKKAAGQEYSAVVEEVDSSSLEVEKSAVVEEDSVVDFG